MIIDSIARSLPYASLGDRIARGLAYLASFDASTFTEGRVAIDGDDIFALCQAPTTLAAAGRLYEAHRRYIDIQYIVEGAEAIRVTDVDRLREATPYDADKDVAFYDLAEGSTALLSPGDFALLFPHDAHLPLLPATEPATVRKIVVKVRV